MVMRDQALNERDYGDLVGLNKQETANKFGGKNENGIFIINTYFNILSGDKLRFTVSINSS